MNKLVVALIAMIFISAAAFAGKINVEGGISLTKFNYEETQNAQLLDSERKINLPGVWSKVSYEESYGAFGPRLWEMEGSFIYGATRYIGQPLDGTGSYGDINANTNNTLWHIEGAVREEVSIMPELSLPIRMGAGYRNWERALADGNIETYTWSYLSIGTGASFSLSSDISLGVSIDYRHAINPSISLDLPSSYAVTPSNVDLKLGATDGYHINVPIVYYVSSKMSVKFAYDYEYWMVKRSESKTLTDTATGFPQQIWEPQSKTANHRLMLGLGYLF